ncbi:MAG: hypothetical protein QOD46_219 [Actinomycetota bacterium]|jgi:hypothetical protein|nr:hypothetical protein [Actinomycetota bacterium]
MPLVIHPELLAKWDADSVQLVMDSDAPGGG